MERRTTTMLMTSVAFGGGLRDPECENDLEPNFDLAPELAAAELRQAGYEVFVLPDEHRVRLAHPLDDFIEVVITATEDSKVIDAAVKEIEAIVGKYGGLCIDCGLIGREYVPFDDLLKNIERRG
jgi:hypothetical protein